MEAWISGPAPNGPTDIDRAARVTSANSPVEAKPARLRLSTSQSLRAISRLLERKLDFTALGGQLVGVVGGPDKDPALTLRLRDLAHRCSTGFVEQRRRL